MNYNLQEKEPCQEKSRHAGRQEELVDIIFMQLTLLLGKLEDKTEKRIHSLEPGALEALSEALPGFACVIDLKQWLERQD